MGSGSANQDDSRQLYLELLRATLTGALSEDNDLILGLQSGGAGVKGKVANLVGSAAQRLGFELSYKRPYDAEARRNGRDWPPRAESMIGQARMENLSDCIETVLREDIPGDLIETGVWRGGATIYMRGVLKAYGVTDRTVWAADSFEGLPRPDPHRYPADRDDQHFRMNALQIGVDQVRDNFRRYGLLDDQVKFLVGWFKDTLPTAPLTQLAVLRLDGDIYESTMQSLTYLYPKLSDGGYCIIDDYGYLETCKAAVEDYRGTHQITEPIVDIDGFGAFWRKSALPQAT
ncbi:MAG: TylF/MycF family methyltransferase [Actinomycetota bacterium]|nr:TylF/MycF family methyltransferase [Actinomycetota bacterium]